MHRSDQSDGAVSSTKGAGHCEEKRIREAERIRREKSRPMVGPMAHH